MRCPTCPQTDFARGGGFENERTCPKDSAVGTVTLRGNFGESGFIGLPLTQVVVNLKPGPNEPARFGFRALTASVILRPSIRTGGDYGLTVNISDSSQGLPAVGSELRFWGVPGDSSHDELRGGPEGKGEFAPFRGPVRPFLSNPTSCTGPVLTTLRMNSWQEPGNYQEAGFLSHNAAMEPVGADGCDKLSFEPSLELQSNPPSAAQPAALSATLNLPQHDQDLNGLVTSHLKKAVVKLPEGVAVNPAAANGLGACSEAQFGYHNANPVSCPADSKVGSAEVVTPLLEDPMKGSIYLAQQNANPFGSLLAVYMVVEGHGVTAKIAGKIDTDPNTRPAHRDLRRKPAAAVQRPQAGLLRRPRRGAGQPERLRQLQRHQHLHLVVRRHREREQLRRHQPELRDGRLQPELRGRDHEPGGGQLLAVCRRRDPQRRRTEHRRDRHHPAEGRRAKIAGVPLCPEANAADGSCPASSQVGAVNVAAGAGPNPVWVPQPGKSPTAVYLAGPYKGDPYSLVFRVPVQAGPFDLGTVVTRASISVNPDTAQVSVASDSLPQILKGIPIGYRQIHVDDQPAGLHAEPDQLRTNRRSPRRSSPTRERRSPRPRASRSAAAGRSASSRRSTPGSGARPTAARTRSCGRSSQPRKGDANVGRVALTLPRSEFLDQAHIKTICTRVQFAAGACPQASVYGWAKAKTPLFDQMFEGPGLPALLKPQAARPGGRPARARSPSTWSGGSTARTRGSAPPSKRPPTCRSPSSSST